MGHLDGPCPVTVDAMVTIWTSLHKQLEVAIEPAETHYLRGIILRIDDELVARLMAAKLSMSRPLAGSGGPAAAAPGSDVVFSVQGREQRARLVYGAATEEGRLGVGTRFGAALLGLREGQSLLWPHDHGRLVEVKLLEVRSNRPPNGARPANAVLPGGRPPCAFG